MSLKTLRCTLKQFNQFMARIKKASVNPNASDMFDNLPIPVDGPHLDLSKYDDLRQSCSAKVADLYEELLQICLSINRDPSYALTPSQALAMNTLIKAGVIITK